MKTSKPIKILVDCHKFDENFQGITSYLKGLYTELIKNSDYHFYLVSANSDSLKEIFGESSNVTYLNYFSRNKWFRLLFDIPFKIWKYKINFAHFQYVASPLKFCKYIVTIHDVLFLDYPNYFGNKYRFKNNFLFKNSAKLANVLLTVSEYSKERIVFYYKLTKEITVVPNAINEEYLNAFDKNESKKYISEKYNIVDFILMVSRIEPRKNHLLLLKSFVEATLFERFQLVLIGKRDLDYQDFEIYLSGLPKNVLKNIHLLENIDNSDLLEFYRAANIFVYPSFAEGFGIPPLESIAVGTPTLCSNKTAMADFDFLEDCFFDPNDKDDLKNKLLIPPKAFNVHSQKEKMLLKYNWTNNAKIFLDALHKKT